MLSSTLRLPCESWRFFCVIFLKWIKGSWKLLSMKRCEDIREEECVKRDVDKRDKERYVTFQGKIIWTHTSLYYYLLTIGWENKIGLHIPLLMKKCLCSQMYEDFPKPKLGIWEKMSHLQMIINICT